MVVVTVVVYCGVVVVVLGNLLHNVIFVLPYCLVFYLFVKSCNLYVFGSFNFACLYWIGPIPIS